MSNVLDNIKSRRSVRNFNSRQISDDELASILEAAVYAPSAMNRQPWKFTVLQNKGLLDALSKEIKKAFDMPDDKVYNFYGAPTLIIVSTEKNNPTGAQDCAVALQNIFLEARDLEIGSCWINQLHHVCDIPEIRSLLQDMKIPNDHTVWGCAALGYTDEFPKCPERKNGIVKIIK